MLKAQRKGVAVYSFYNAASLTENGSSLLVLNGQGSLNRLSEETGGKYWKPDMAGKIPTEITFSEAGITTRETYDLWNMPIVFLLAMLLRGSEWLLRRRWGVI